MHFPCLPALISTPFFSFYVSFFFNDISFWQLSWRCCLRVVLLWSSEAPAGTRQKHCWHLLQAADFCAFRFRHCWCSLVARWHVGKIVFDELWSPFLLIIWLGDSSGWMSVHFFLFVVVAAVWYVFVCSPLGFDCSAPGGRPQKTSMSMLFCFVFLVPTPVDRQSKLIKISRTLAAALLQSASINEIYIHSKYRLCQQHYLLKHLPLQRRR